MSEPWMNDETGGDDRSADVWNIYNESSALVWDALQAAGGRIPSEASQAADQAYLGCMHDNSLRAYEMCFERGGLLPDNERAASPWDCLDAWEDGKDAGTIQGSTHRGSERSQSQSETNESHGGLGLGFAEVGAGTARGRQEARSEAEGPTTGYTRTIRGYEGYGRMCMDESNRVFQRERLKVAEPYAQ
jgi:hypothetical protein